MLIGILGINHKSADLNLRETFARACQRRFGPDSFSYIGMSYVLLSTCNRTEIYFSSDDLAATHTFILNLLRKDIHEEFEHKVYSYFGEDCFLHLARVTSGIDSAMIGETEIQGQVKKAYEAFNEHHLSSSLHFLFQKCLKIGKDIRSKTSLSLGMPSFEETLLQVGQQLLGDLSYQNILFIGVSEINQKICQHFSRSEISNIAFCNRSSSRGIDVSNQMGGKYLSWGERDAWCNFDMLIFGTKASEYLLRKDDVDGFTKKTTLIVDLSVPRNVDPKIAKCDHVTLLNVDQINKAVDRKCKLKAQEIAQIEAHMIVQAVQKQMDLYRLKEYSRRQLAFA